MPQKTLLITGSSGYLGQHLTPKAAERFKLYAAYNTHPDQIKAGQPIALNLAHQDEVQRVITELRPDAIIHAAALNPGTDEALMFQINAAGSRYVAEAALTIGARLVYVSTDAFHDGKNSPYNDDAPPTPVNLYSRSKAMAEAAIARINPNAAMVRTSLIYGLDIMDRGTEGFVKRLEQGEPLILFNDVIRQPIWAESLVKALLKLVDLDFRGTLNVVGGQPLSRAAYGRRMLAWWQVDPKGLLASGRAADILDNSMPLDIRLTTHKAEHLLQMSLPGLDDVLAQATPAIGGSCFSIKQE